MLRQRKRKGKSSPPYVQFTNLPVFSLRNSFPGRPATRKDPPESRCISVAKSIYRIRGDIEEGITCNMSNLILIWCACVLSCSRHIRTYQRTNIRVYIVGDRKTAACLSPLPVIMYVDAFTCHRRGQVGSGSRACGRHNGQSLTISPTMHRITYILRMLSVLSCL